MITWYAATCRSGSEAAILRKAGRLAFTYVPVMPAEETRGRTETVPLLAEGDEHGYVFMGLVGQQRLGSIVATARQHGLIDWLRDEQRSPRQIDPQIIEDLRRIEADIFAEHRARCRRRRKPGDRIKVRRSRKSKRASPARALRLAAIRMRLVGGITSAAAAATETKAA